MNTGGAQAPANLAPKVHTTHGVKPSNKQAMIERVKKRWRAEIRQGTRKPGGAVTKPKATAPVKGKTPATGGAAPRNPFGAQVNADVQLKYGDAMRQAKDALAAAGRDTKGLDIALKAYTDQHRLEMQRAQAESALGRAQEAQQLQGAAQMGADLIKGIGAAAPALPGGNDPQGQLAAVQGLGINALGSANAMVFANAIAALDNRMQEQQGHTATLANAEQHAAAQIRTDRARGDLVALGKDRGAFAVADRQKLGSDAADRELAVQSLLQKDSASMRDYRVAIKKLGLDKYLGKLSSDTKITTNAATNATSTANTQAKIQADAKQKALDRATKVKVAKIGAKGSGGGTGPGGDMTKSERHRARQSAQSIFSAIDQAGTAFHRGDVAKDIRVQLARIVGKNNPAVLDAVMRAAQTVPQDHRTLKAVASLFPNGVIPPSVRKALGR